MPTETTYMLALTFLQGLSYAQQLRSLQHYGTAAALFADTHPQEQRLREALTGRSEALRRAEKELAYCEANHIRPLCFGTAAYPVRLANCPDPPLVLFCLGEADLNARHIVAVVGTRHATEYGKDLCRHFSEDLKRLVPDALLVSGLAYGIDIHAHRGALNNNMPTVGVLAHGLDRIYPAQHRETARRMIHEGGGLLTEYPIGTTPERGNFVRRNRIVAGLADATIVVESAEKGGALITAQLAQDYNRDVFAYPGRTTDIYSIGCNNLIKNNCAALITSAEDFALSARWIDEKAKDKAEPIQRELFPELNEEEALVVKSLSDQSSKPISLIVSETKMAFNRVNIVLGRLELKGIVKGLPGGMYRLLR